MQMTGGSYKIKIKKLKTKNKFNKN